MAERKSIFANVSALAAGQMIAMGLGFVTHAILARAVGPADYGILGFSLAVVSYFGIAAALGTDSWAAREISTRRSEARAIVETILSLRIALTLLSFGGLLIFITIWRPEPIVAYMLLIQSVGLFSAALTLDFAFQGMERMNAIARRFILSALVALAGIATSVSLGGSIVVASSLLQLAAAVSAIVMIWEFTRIVGCPRPQWQIEEWRRILREATPLAVTVLVTTVYIYIDIVMLGILRPGTEVGQYVASTRILAVGLVAASILRSAILPVLARLQSSPVERKDIGTHHARLVATAGSLAAVGGFLLAPEILEIVFGTDFRDAANTLRILMICLLLMNAIEVFHTQLVAWRLQTQQMWIIIAGTAANIGLNAVLIPRYGMEGAASATLVSSVLILALAAIVLRRNGYETHAGPMAAAMLLAVALGVFGWQIDAPVDGTMTRVLVIGCAVTVAYAALAWILGIAKPVETFRRFNRP